MNGIRGRDVDRGVQDVWDFPRPPAVVACERRVRVEVAGVVVADSAKALSVLETSHPPTIYMPPEDVRGDVLVASDARGTTCEFKGRADYLDVVVGDDRRRQVAWTYPEPWKGYEELAGYVASTRAGWTPRGSATSASPPRRATSTAAGSRRTSSGRSRAGRARWAGSA